MKNKWWIIGGSVIVVVVAMSFFSGNHGMPVRVAVAGKGAIDSYVEERARTSLPRIYHITMPLDGRIQPLQLDEGDQVKRDAEIARLDAADLKTAVSRAQAQLAAIESQIKVNEYDAIERTALKESDNMITSVDNAVKASKKKVEASQAREKYAKWWLDKAEQLHKQSSAALQQLKQARTEHVQARVDFQSDEFVYYALEAIATATRLMPVYVKQFLERKRLTRAVLLNQKQEAAATLAQARRNLQRAIIRSPITGVVLKRYVVNERVLAAGAPIAELGNLDNLQVTADILSEEVVKVKVNDRVEIFGAFIRKPLAGKVAQIKPKGFTKISSLGVEQQRVAVVIDIDPKALADFTGKGQRLGLDYRVRIRIYTGGKQQALKIPRTCLFRGNSGQWQVFMVRQGRLRQSAVTVGLANNDEAEILTGLQAGDRVVVAPESALTNGSPVVVVN